MRVPYSWLREYCDPGIGAEELAERLAMTGTEVERVETRRAAAGDGFHRRSGPRCEPHPDADRLRVCTVDVGDGRAADDRLRRPQRRGRADRRRRAAGRADAGWPEAAQDQAARGRLRRDDPLRRRARARRGPDGIMVLEEGAAPGTPLAEVLPLAESVLELEVTPNRVDCLGVYGVAREVHAISGAPLAPEPWTEDAPAGGEGEVADNASVTVEVPDLCPRFTARVFTDVTIAPSPAWLKARLAAAGQRPINNVVDITNYVMLLTAQPLHAFDLDRVPGGALSVRTADEGETMRTLDGVERTLDSETVLVCDANGPVGYRRDHGRPDLRGLRATTRVSCSRSPTGTAPTSCAPRANSACARRPPRALRSSCTRSSACGRSASPRG